VEKTRHIEQRFPFPMLFSNPTYLGFLSILVTLLRLRPDFIIPGDEKAVNLLQQLLTVLKALPWLKGGATAATLERSLAAKDAFPLMLNKYQFFLKCRSIGIRVPQTFIITNRFEAVERAKELGYPVVLKLANSSGGFMVKVCDDVAALEEHFEAIKAESNRWQGGCKRLVRQLLFIPVPRNHICLQQYIQGQVGLHAIVARCGQILSHITAYKTRTYPGSTGPSSVISGGGSAELQEFAGRFAQSVGFNGFGSIDFIRDSATGQISLLEFNPRPVPISHLGSITSGSDLCLALYRDLVGLPQTAHINNDKFTIALFPNELRRDCASEFLHARHVYHDIPEDDPELLAHLGAMIEQSIHQTKLSPSAITVSPWTFSAE
jgi:hypothetical protein